MAKMLTALLILLAAGAAGCAARPAGEPELAVGGDRYGAAFDAARAVLRDARFDLDRVDARAGVITTHPKKSLGLLTPWDPEQTSAHAEVDDLFNRQRRFVRVTFEPADGSRPLDLLGAGPPDTVMRISVVIEREQQPGWRLESTSVRLNSRAVDLELVDRGMTPWYTLALAQDPVYGAELAAQVRERLAAPRGDAAGQ